MAEIVYGQPSIKRYRVDVCKKNVSSLVRKIVKIGKEYRDTVILNPIRTGTEYDDTTTLEIGPTGKCYVSDIKRNKCFLIDYPTVKQIKDINWQDCPKNKALFRMLDDADKQNNKHNPRVPAQKRNTKKETSLLLPANDEILLPRGLKDNIYFQWEGSSNGNLMIKMGSSSGPILCKSGATSNPGNILANNILKSENDFSQPQKYFWSYADSNTRNSQYNGFSFASKEVISQLNSELDELENVKNEVDEDIYLNSKASTYLRYDMFTEANKIVDSGLLKYPSSELLHLAHSNLFNDIDSINSLDQNFMIREAGVLNNTETLVAILPFQSADKIDSKVAHQLQATIAEILSNNNQIIALELPVHVELESQIERNFVAPNSLVSKSKELGVQHLILGGLLNIDTVKQSAYSKYAHRIINGIGNNSGNYKVSLKYSLQIVDVETGKIVSKRIFSDTTNSNSASFALLGFGNSKEDAITNAIENNRNVISKWIDDFYGIQIKVERIEERKKSGEVELLLVSGLASDTKVGTEYIVLDTELLDGIKREKEAAIISFVKNEGVLSICKVIHGADFLEKKLSFYLTLKPK